MRKNRFSEEQISDLLQEAEAGAVLRDLCRRRGITETRFYRWRTKNGGMQVSEARRLKHLEEENRRLKQIVADQALACGWAPQIPRSIGAGGSCE